MKQVALKAAVELINDKFDPNNDIGNQLEVIRNISNNLFELFKRRLRRRTKSNL